MMATVSSTSAVPSPIDDRPVRLAVIGTSWWADAMYLPAIADHPDVELVAVCGRNPTKAEQFADKWGFAHWYTHHQELLDQTRPDAVIVATSNDVHVEIATDALDAGAHLLCEKPLGRSASEATAIAEAARRAGRITFTPFTYAEMPTNRFIGELVDEGRLGRPHHLNLRYYTGFSFEEGYAWRFDKAVSGTGVIGDIGSHFLYLAHQWFGDVTSVAATTRTFVDHGPRPDGSAIEPTNDSGVITLEFANGAYGVIHATAVCWEGTPFGQIHEFDLHGDGGTIHSVCDWDTRQEVRYLARGEVGPAPILELPPHLTDGLRMDTMHNTYRDVFRTTPALTRRWIDAIVAGTDVQPDLATGARIAELVDAALESDEHDGVRIDTSR